VYEGPSEEIYDKSTQGKLKSTFSSGLQRCSRFYIHSFSCCCLQNLRNPARFSQKFELITVQGHPRSSTLVSVESAYAIPIRINITLDVSPTVFEILTHLARKQLIFPHHPCLTPLANERPAISTQSIHW